MLSNNSIITTQFFVITDLDVAIGHYIHTFTIPRELPETSFFMFM